MIPVILLFLFSLSRVLHCKMLVVEMYGKDENCMNSSRIGTMFSYRNKCQDTMQHGKGVFLSINESNSVNISEYKDSQCGGEPETSIILHPSSFHRCLTIGILNNTYTRIYVVETLNLSFENSYDWLIIQNFKDSKCERKTGYFDDEMKISDRSGFSFIDFNEFRNRNRNRKSFCLKGPSGTFSYVREYSEADSSASGKNLPTNETKILSYLLIENVTNECLDTLFFHDHAMKITCMDDDKFFEAPIVQGPSPNYMVEDVYYTKDCNGLPFAKNLVPLKLCRGNRVLYHQKDEVGASIINIQYNNLVGSNDCGGGNDGIVQVGVSNVDFNQKTCLFFGQQTITQSSTDWYYTMSFFNNVDMSRYAVLVAVPECGLYSNQEIKYFAQTKTSQLLIVEEETCIRREEWSRMMNMGSSLAMRAYCDDEGNLIARNYTVRACGNLHIPIPEYTCITGPAKDYVITCSTFSCDGISEFEEDVCSGHGDCVRRDVCECDEDYYGDWCEEKEVDNSAEITAAVTSLVFVCAAVFFLFFSSQKTKLKKFGKLRNVDILIKEQELEDDNSIAHLRIKSELFQIPMDEISVKHQLGEGGSNSIVYLAIWKGREVAFKCFKTRMLCSNQNDFNEFEREVQVMSSVSHPNIIQFFGCSLQPPRVGILMEYCENGDMMQFLKSYKEEHEGKRYPFDQKIRMLVEISAAMDFLHSRNIIHRDLKLENVLLDAHKKCKIMDFGLSRHIDQLSTRKKTVRIGTSIYMSPELVSSSEYTDKCDVFSFSILFWIIVTENFDPYGKCTNVELKVANSPNYRPDLDLFVSWLPREYQWLTTVLKNCWSHNPDDRLSFAELSEVFNRKPNLEESEFSLVTTK